MTRGWLATPVTGGALLLASVAGADPSVVGSGVVRSDEEVEIKSKAAVPIRRIAVKEGEAVETGQLLVEMANEVQRAEVSEREVQLGSARRELERNLKVPDLITEKELQLSQDAVKLAEAQLAVARANLEDTQIRAPFDGVVSRLYVRLGATPRVADTTLLDLLNLNKLYVEVALPLPVLRSVREGMPVGVVVEGEHAALKTQTVGKVRYIYPKVDPTTRMFRVKVHVDRMRFRILPGMFATVSVRPGVSRN